MNPLSNNALNYTIPRNNRELQHIVIKLSIINIIPYQEIIGNYSYKRYKHRLLLIIPYQEIIGNYSKEGEHWMDLTIIPYQEIIGNYSNTYW